MTPEQFERVAKIFEEVCDLPADARHTRLAQLDPDVRSQVEELLRRDTTMAEFNTPVALPPQSPTNQELPEQIGPYKVMGKLGEGGMGIVLEARQQHPDRRVAIKLLRGLATPEVRSRFEREIKILGQLQHPSIAHIYAADLLTLPSGGVQPYFVMEYIDGLPVHRHVRDYGLGPTDRLQLMAEICDAVDFAHQQGVLHRDLKPGNVMVTRSERGRTSRPKILDFGVGRLLAQPQATRHTETGRLIGTLAYMSPEQIDGSTSDLDARSDVYALGVMLYEMLASQLPINIEGSSLGESLRRIRDEEPQSLASVDPLFRGDIATVVATAMHKDRSKRYHSAAAFAADIRRVLNDEPIVARPATRLYQLRKLVRRHQGVALGLAMTFVTLLVGVIATSWQAIEATRARDVAERETQRAVQIKDFLQQILASAVPNERPSEEITVVSLLDTARERIEAGDFGTAPDIQAELNVTLARGYLSLGHYTVAEKIFHNATTTLRTLPRTAVFAKGLEGLGAAHELQNEYAEAEDCYREAQQVWTQLGRPEHFPAGVWPHGLASVLYFTGRYDEAEQAYRDAVATARIELEPTDVKIAQALSGLGVTLEAKGAVDEAIAAHREAADIYRAAQGDHSIHVANTLNNLGNALQGNGDIVEAARVQREALAIRRHVFRDNHPDVAMSLSNLGLVIRDLGELEEAEQMMREALAIRQEVLPPVHHATAVTWHNLGTTLVAQERHEEALAALDEAVAMAEKAVPAGHLMIHVFRANRAYCQFKLGQIEPAESQLRASHAALVEQVGADHRRTQKIATDLAELYEATNRQELAKKFRPVEQN